MPEDVFDVFVFVDPDNCFASATLSAVGVLAGGAAV
jgi:hypothetical protein